MRNIDVQPSEIRRRVLEQHKTIRERVAALEELALAVGSGRADYGDLPGAFEGVLSLLGTHMRFEDGVLPTLLFDADACGEARVARFHADHLQQQKIIQNLLDVVAQRGDLERALLALGFCSLLRKDMDYEERVFLSEEVLRDDPVVIHPEPE